ncbi:MAG TPA: DegQ family serine endoprotease [Deltaproteobacteria bacterium]|nr:DegQ family serine endoprotease [Deltaproteobacteria bacterium]
MFHTRTYQNYGQSLKQLLVSLWVFFTLVMVSMPTVLQAQEEGLENLKQTGKAFATIAREASPAVVFIKVEKTVQSGPAIGPSPFSDEFFRRFFGEPFPNRPMPSPRQRERQVRGQGSGFIISPDGYILTNNHVVGEADRIQVKLLDGREFTAKVIGTDPPTDVAVIKIDAANLPVLAIGDSDTLEVGEWVLALGNPFGLSHTLTAGIVSALGRTSVGITDYEDFIQTDAAINPGNSGGPLINLEGKAIGINTAIYSGSGGYMGIGFAIPVNMAKNIYAQLVEHGEVTRGYLGVTIQDLTTELAKSFGLNDTNGVLISQVMPDTPAEKAGLKQGDIVVKFNGEPVESVAPFRNRVALVGPGTRVNITVLRDGKQKTFTVTIERLASAQQAEPARPESLEKLGLTVTNLTNELAERFGYQDESGVLVTEVQQGSAAAAAGIRPGVLIQEVNRKQIKDVKEFEQAIEKGGDKPILLLVKDERGSRYIALDIQN